MTSQEGHVDVANYLISANAVVNKRTKACNLLCLQYITIMCMYMYMYIYIFCNPSTFHTHSQCLLLTTHVLLNLVVLCIKLYLLSAYNSCVFIFMQDSRTALYQASKNGRVAVIQLLLQKHANVNISSEVRTICVIMHCVLRILYI